MKRFLKTFFITFVICCSIVGVFLLRNYLILNKIRKLQIDTWSKIENLNNFTYDEFSITTTGYIQGIKLYCKDGIYKMIYYDIPQEIMDIKYSNANESKKEDILYSYSVERAFPFVDEERFKNEVKHSILHFIKSKDNQYITSQYIKSPLRDSGYDYSYFNKETGMLEKYETIYRKSTCKITENIVTDYDVAKPQP